MFILPLPTFYFNASLITFIGSKVQILPLLSNFDHFLFNWSYVDCAGVWKSNLVPIFIQDKLEISVYLSWNKFAILYFISNNYDKLKCCGENSVDPEQLASSWEAKPADLALHCFQ